MIYKALWNFVDLITRGITPKYTNKGECVVLNQKCIRNGRINISEARKHDNKTKPVAENKVLKKYDILVNSTGVGTLGRVAQNYNDDSQTTVDSHITIVRPGKDVNPVFLGYVLRWRQAEIEALAEGSTGQTELSRQRLGNEITVPVFSLAKQKKIAKILSSLDDKIELNNAINHNLEQQICTVFRTRFTNNPYFEGIEQKPLIELCSVITKGTTPTTIGRRFTKTGIYYIKAESILDNHSIDKNKCAFIDSETNNLLKRSEIRVGDIVFTIAGTLGRFSLIDKNILPANTNQAVAIIRVDTDKISPEYIYACFIGEWHSDFYSKRVQQAVQANLSLTTIKSLPIPILKKDEMSEYLRQIVPIIKLIKANELQNEKLIALRDTLLPKLMRGELAVSEVEI